MPLELHKTPSGLICYSPAPDASRAVALAISLLLFQHTSQGACLRPWGWEKGTPTRLGVFLSFFPAQENPAKLSDQQEAISQGQNPYPIYSAVNVRTNMTGEDFAGAWVYGPRKQMEALLVEGIRGQAIRVHGSLGAQRGCCPLLSARQRFLLRHKGQEEPWGPGGKPLVTFPFFWAPRMVRVHTPRGRLPQVWGLCSLQALWLRVLHGATAEALAGASDLLPAG